METLATSLKALSDPTRLRILRLLDHGELCVCDLMEALQLPQSKVSRHMSFLNHSGWVDGRRSGKWVYYRLAEPCNQLQRRMLQVLRQELPKDDQAQKDYQRLCHHLATKSVDHCD